MTTSQAWLLECSDSLSIAVGFHEVAELLQNHSSYPVAGSPEYCSRVLVWQNNNLVPIMDLALIAGDKPLADAPFVCILKYQEAPRQPLQHLALKVQTAPHRIEIDDEQVCDFPQDSGLASLQSVCLACIEHENRVIMIPDLAGLCSAEFRDLRHVA